MPKPAKADETAAILGAIRVGDRVARLSNPDCVGAVLYVNAFAAYVEFPYSLAVVPLHQLFIK